jgi:hypothetical protein
MKPPVDVDAVALRASRYWMEDGLVEISLGLFFALQAGVYLAWRLPPIWVSAAGSLGIIWGFKKLKDRVTFPRCGYVAFPTPGRARLAFMVLLAVAVTIRGLLKGDTWWLDRIAIAVFVVVFTPRLPRPNLEYKQPRMLWEGFLWLPLSAFMGWPSAVSEFKTVDVLVEVLGVCMVIVGAAQLQSFLKANPRRLVIEV